VVQLDEQAVHLVWPLTICSNSPVLLQVVPQVLVLVERTRPGAQDVQMSLLEKQVTQEGSQALHEVLLWPSTSWVER
jgi:hypothetical protein